MATHQRSQIGYLKFPTLNYFTGISQYREFMTNYRNQFNLPADLAYLNTAYMGPALRAAQEAGMTEIQRLGNPSLFKEPEFFDPPRRVRELFAELIDCDDPDRIAHVPSASYAIANVARQVKLAKGSTIILLGNQFPSNYYVWANLCKEYDCKLLTIPAPTNADNKAEEWNKRIVDAIDINTTLVTMPPLHWSDGTLFDLKAIREKTRSVGALFIVDGSQAVGAMPLSVRTLQPDALICAGYKWLFSPYGSSYAYYGPYFDNGTPIEESWIVHEGCEDFSNLANYNFNYRPKGLRYCSGQHPAPIHIAMQRAALEQVLNWSVDTIQAHVQSLSHVFTTELRNLGATVADEAHRAKHLFGFKLPDTVNMEKLTQELERRNVVLSRRGAYLRVSLHLFNSEEEVGRLVEAVREVRS